MVNKVIAAVCIFYLAASESSVNHAAAIDDEIAIVKARIAALEAAEAAGRKQDTTRTAGETLKGAKSAQEQRPRTEAKVTKQRSEEAKSRFLDNRAHNITKHGHPDEKSGRLIHQAIEEAQKEKAAAKIRAAVLAKADEQKQRHAETEIAKQRSELAFGKTKAAKVAKEKQDRAEARMGKQRSELAAEKAKAATAAKEKQRRAEAEIAEQRLPLAAEKAKAAKVAEENRRRAEAEMAKQRSGKAAGQAAAQFPHKQEHADAVLIHRKYPHLGPHDKREMAESQQLNQQRKLKRKKVREPQQLQEYKRTKEAKSSDDELYQKYPHLYPAIIHDKTTSNILVENKFKEASTKGAHKRIKKKTENYESERKSNTEEVSQKDATGTKAKLKKHSKNHMEKTANKDSQQETASQSKKADEEEKAANTVRSAEPKKKSGWLSWLLR